MSEKRKDNKGRILRTGESQRKGLIYQYRYADIRNKQQTVYSSDLKELREKEKEIQKQLDDGIDYLPENLRRVTVICVGFRHNSKNETASLQRTFIEMRAAYVFRMLSIHWQRKKRRIYDSARAEYINKMPLCPFFYPCET